jgi:hypothetical protein
MATLSVQTIALAGITPTYAAVAAGGDVFANDGSTYVEIVNSSGANSYTITFTTPATYQGVAVADPTVTVGTSTRKKIGPFPPSAFNNSTGQVAITYTGSAPATDLTIGVFAGV